MIENSHLALRSFAPFAVKYLELLTVPHPRRAGFWCYKEKWLRERRTPTRREPALQDEAHEMHVAAVYDYFSPAGKVDANEMTLCHWPRMVIGGHRRATTMRQICLRGSKPGLGLIDIIFKDHLIRFCAAAWFWMWIMASLANPASTAPKSIGNPESTHASLTPDILISPENDLAHLDFLGWVLAGQRPIS